MAPKEGAVLLRSLGNKFWKILFAEAGGPHFQRDPLAGRKVPGPRTKDRNRIFLNFCRAYPQRGLTAKAGGPLQRRHNHGNGPDGSAGDVPGRHRRSITRNATVAVKRLPPRGSAPEAPFRANRLARNPLPHLPSRARFPDWSRLVAPDSTASAALSVELLEPGLRCLICNLARTSDATDRWPVPRRCPERRLRLARKGLVNNPCDRWKRRRSASGRARAGGLRRPVRRCPRRSVGQGETLVFAHAGRDGAADLVAGMVEHGAPVLEVVDRCRRPAHHVVNDAGAADDG